MHLLFLVPLTTGLVSGYFFKNAVDEMAYLTGVITIVSLFLSLVLAPWQLQLLLLVLVIFSTRKLLLLNQSPPDLPDQAQLSTTSAVSELNQQETTSKSSKYRGISYKPMAASTTLLETEGELTGKYRGASWKTRNTKQASMLVNPKLKYRGAKARNQASDNEEVK